MNITRPAMDSYTIYSKSGCLYCTKAKGLLQNERIPTLIVDCDKFLLGNKEEFFDQMKSLIGYEYKTFPMILKTDDLLVDITKQKTFTRKVK
jgi:glutaredoxin